MKIKPKTKPFRLSLGDRGEIIAAAYLADRGYQILDKKVRASFGELDLVARDKNEIVFVEVKTRSGATFGRPEEAVGAIKQKQMYRLAQWYLQKNKLLKMNARFDVIAIFYDGVGEPKIRHIPNAFDVPDSF